MLSKYLRGQKGSILVLTTVMLTVLVGITALVIDGGRLYLTKSELQNVADAAALAGVQKLPGSMDDAKTVANVYANANCQTGDTIKAPVVTATSVRAGAERTVDLTFARIFGYSSTSVSAYATAQIEPRTSIKGLRPWGLSGPSFTYGQELIVKWDGSANINGWFGIISFPSQQPSAKTYKDNIKDGCDVPVDIGNTVNNDSGNSGNKNVKTFIEDNIFQGTSDNYLTAADGSPRVVLIPHLNSSMEIIGFAAVFVKSVDNQGDITVNFLKFTDKNGTEIGQGNWGLYRAKLVE